MSWFKRLFGGLSGGGGRPSDAIWLYVRCAACAEAIQVRIDPAHDLSPEFDGEHDYTTGYNNSKEIVGQRCFRRIHVDLSFDARKRVIEQQIAGGTFITAEEYEAEQRVGGP